MKDIRQGGDIRSRGDKENIGGDKNGIKSDQIGQFTPILAEVSGNVRANLSKYGFQMKTPVSHIRHDMTRHLTGHAV